MVLIYHACVCNCLILLAMCYAVSIGLSLPVLVKVVEPLILMIAADPSI